MISELTSGECRRVSPERPDIHVYCRHQMVETMMPWGRPGWQRRPDDARYCVVCPDEGLEYGNWVTAAEAAAVVDRLTRQEARAWKRTA